MNDFGSGTNDRCGEVVIWTFDCSQGSQKQSCDGSRETLNLVVTSLAEGLGEPLQTFVKTISGGSTSGLDVPGTLSQAV